MMGVERGGKQGQGSTRRLQAMQGLRGSQQLAFEPIFGLYIDRLQVQRCIVRNRYQEENEVWCVECLCQGNPAPPRISRLQNELESLACRSQNFAPNLTCKTVR